MAAFIEQGTVGQLVPLGLLWSIYLNCTALSCLSLSLHFNSMKLYCHAIFTGEIVLQERIRLFE